MKIKLLTLFILISTFCFAQSMHFVKLQPTEINLSKRQFFVSGVIDNRPNKKIIGFVQKGITNKKVKAAFKEPFTTYLQKVFDKMIPSNESMIPVIVKVHTLYISETTTAFKEMGSAEIVLEFLSADTSSSLGIYQAIKKGKGIDVTKKHDEQILEALKSCLFQLTQKWETVPEELPVLTTFSFDPNSPSKEGLYRSFSDFIRNKPITSISFELIPLSRKLELYKVQYKDKKEKLKDIYGISDGINFYLNAAKYSYETHFTKAQFTGTYFYFEDRVSDTGAMMMFGLIGALASGKKIGIALDTHTGLISQLNRDYLAIILKDYPKLRKMYNGSNKKMDAKKKILKEFNQVLANEKSDN